MARTCSLCGRGAMNSNSRSHSNIATANKQHINIQTLMLKGTRLSACTSCIRKESKRLTKLSQVPKTKKDPTKP